MGLKKLFAAAAVAGMFACLLTAAPAQATNIGDEGCTPGYWKNHTSNWQEYKATTKLTDQFNLAGFTTKWGGKTFLDALKFQGGSGADGAFQILMRATTAAFLNAAHEGLGYPLRRFGNPGDMLDTVNGVLARGNRAEMLALAAEYDSLNNSGCPLN